MRSNEKRTNEEYNNNTTIRKKSEACTLVAFTHFGYFVCLNSWREREKAVLPQFFSLLFFLFLLLLYWLCTSRVAYIIVHIILLFILSFIHHILIFSLLYMNMQTCELEASKMSIISFRSIWLWYVDEFYFFYVKSHKITYFF
jgi:hypothetical protein